ncbi:ClC family H(+)/Cl(-) exchange transporter [Candidatus Mycobacterium wuenschmannii]|uniref:ClC family H(+)/Cl(-) exchange transporter n=1 Tax=Candidatus Mycobacterium wuenschmannii TaxID=3027808 RepID=A0ABY8VS46_9MYCO|nr:ClC family H(+)/Cl(-) exchange transporter [Candidatus Mycobacterium wuenschmannii]WIM85825.1 ClC family H(+)/Cl(-) exchange transporter [Candidatus Mycobacterium wuenschmannii]
MSDETDSWQSVLRSLFTGWQRPTVHPVDSEGEGAESLIGFVIAAALVGVLTGLSAATFKLLLHRGARLRADLAHWAHGSGWGLAVVVLVCMAAAAIAAALVHRIEPHAEGSGIPRVEAVADGRVRPDRFRILPIKYIGGLLAISSGMALGREGPSVQMGGSAAVIVATLTRRNMADLRVLVAGGAAAGLATAFNAPIAGGVFVLEELLKRFDPRTTIATLVASGSGFAAARLLVSPDNEFYMPPLGDPRLLESGWVFAIGIVTGVLGVLYNEAVMGALRHADASRLPREVRAAATGALVGLIVWAAPDLAGSGDNLTQSALLGHGTLLAIAGIFAVRFALGVVSYAAATPGGLFAPMLVLGSEAGLLVGLVAAHFTPHAMPSLGACALIGMAAFFTASVHAPVTGLILATEMTGNTNQLPPMLGACAVAMLVAVAVRSEPIYDRLAHRAARANASDHT